MTAIIILNWNGADDTIMCLESLAAARGSFFVVVADNGSADDSVARLRQYKEDSSLDIRLLELDRNYGFAGGNNRAVKFASKDNPDAYLLLNNDTEVTPGFLERLEEFRNAHKEYCILTPRINYFFDKDIIWNCGGVLRFGFRRYRYAGCNSGTVKDKEFLPISFVTGCALYFLPEVLEPDGSVLTERFFFGEEDFDLSLRMKRRGLKMACVTDSVIYHKVGSAGNRMYKSGKVYLHLLNRYIDVRINSGRLFFMLWRIVAFFFTIRAFRKTFGLTARALGMYRSLIRDMRSKDGVSRSDFESLVIKGDYFNEKDRN